MRRRFFVIVAFTAVLLAGGISLYWLWAADQLARGIAQWAEEQRARGYEVVYDGPDIGGFPVRLSARFGQPRIAAPDGWRWAGEALTGEAALWAPRTIRLDLPKRQDITVPWRGQKRDLTLEAAAANGEITLGSAGGMQTAVVEMAGLTLTDDSGLAATAESARIAATQRPPTMEGVDDWTLIGRGRASGVKLPPGAGGPLGDAIAQAAVEVTLLGAIPPGDPAVSLALWRDAGGLLEVEMLELDWGPLGFSADGTATLDQQLRPQAALTARMSGLPGTIDALADHGLVKPGAALGIKIMVMTLATKTDGDGKPVVELPITLQDGLFYLGPAPLFPLAPVL